MVTVSSFFELKMLGDLSPPVSGFRAEPWWRFNGAKPSKNFDIYRQKDARCSNFTFNLSVFEEYFRVDFVIILVGTDATC